MSRGCLLSSCRMPRPGFKCGVFASKVRCGKKIPDAALPALLDTSTLLLRGVTPIDFFFFFVSPTIIGSCSSSGARSCFGTTKSSHRGRGDTIGPPLAGVSRPSTTLVTPATSPGTAGRRVGCWSRSRAAWFILPSARSAALFLGAFTPLLARIFRMQKGTPV